jgi:sirohydrochlorin cobaltochelatase
MTHALLIIGHGTRDADGQRECARLLEVVRERRGDLRVELGFLELCPPPITDVVADLAADGVHDVTVVPLVLLGAGHAKGDVPAAIARERLRHPGMHFRYARPLGIRPELLDTVDRRLCDAVGEEHREDTAVVLVGRGTSDPDANGDLAKVARMLWEGRPWPLVEPAFVSLARPSVPEALERCRRLGATRIAVTPYFLFTGVLERRIRDEARAWADDHPEIEVVDAGYLGPDEQVAEVLLARAAESEAGAAIANCDTCQYRVALPGFEERVGEPQTLHEHPDDPGTHGHRHGHRHGADGHGHRDHRHDRATIEPDRVASGGRR